MRENAGAFFTRIERIQYYQSRIVDHASE